MRPRGLARNYTAYTRQTRPSSLLPKPRSGCRYRLQLSSPNPGDMRRRPTEACHRCREPDTGRCPTRLMMAWVRTPGPCRNHHRLPPVCRERRYCDQRGWSLWLGGGRPERRVRRSQSIARRLAGMGRSLMSPPPNQRTRVTFRASTVWPAGREHERARRRITVRHAGDLRAVCSTFARTSHCECRLLHQEWIRCISGRTERLWLVRKKLGRKAPIVQPAGVVTHVYPG